MDHIAPRTRSKEKFMDVRQDKVMTLEAAVKKYVSNGSHISIGGFTVNRNPMAAVYEIIRQGIKNLHAYAHSNGTGIDELVGGGCVGKIEIAYGGNGRAAPTCIRFKKAIQEGTIVHEDYSNYQMSLRFHAGAMGIPFLPTRSSLGTDIVNKWGFSKDLRSADPKIPDEKLVVLDNPFEGWCDCRKVVLVPAINPDVTILHVQKADRQGTCRILGLTFCDIDQAKAAKNVIVTCEELVESSELRADPEYNQIPFIHVSAVVHVPYGAYPSSCFRYYDYDPTQLSTFAKAAKDDALFKDYVQKYVFDAGSHQGLLDMVGKERIAKIKADPRTGYATGLDRK
jgi:glutaconate CoA-transferase subunit A